MVLRISKAQPPGKPTIHVDMTMEEEVSFLAEQGLEEEKEIINKWNADRAEGYGSIPYQLDLMFHQGIEGWKAHIQSVKDSLPKIGA